jgi:hypothetical protein
VAESAAQGRQIAYSEEDDHNYVIARFSRRANNAWRPCCLGAGVAQRKARCRPSTRVARAAAMWVALPYGRHTSDRSLSETQHYRRSSRPLPFGVRRASHHRQGWCVPLTRQSQGRGRYPAARRPSPAQCAVKDRYSRLISPIMHQLKPVSEAISLANAAPARARRLTSYWDTHAITIEPLLVAPLRAASYPLLRQHYARHRYSICTAMINREVAIRA